MRAIGVGLYMQVEKVFSLICPRCPSSLVRVRRSFSDRFISLFVPVWRCRCTGVACGWEGPIRVARSDASTSAHYTGGQLLEP